MFQARFQVFDDQAEPEKSQDRIGRLRSTFSDLGIDGFIVPRADEHQGEYVPPSEERLAWLTGFTGSAGLCIVLPQTAALFVDGRYALQVRDQVDLNVVTPVAIADSSPQAWLEQNAPAGARIGFDPRLMTPDQAKRYREALEKIGASLVALSGNPIDRIWNDRPASPSAAVVDHPVDLAGETREEKIRRVQDALRTAKADALLVSDPHAVAWMLNVRGGDVAHTPLPICYGLVTADGRSTLFIGPDKVSDVMRDSLSAVADIQPVEALPAALSALGRSGWRVRLDAESAGERWRLQIVDAGGHADIGADPIALMKAVKNPTEMEGARAAQRRDGVAVTRFLRWLEGQAATGELTEIDAAAALEHFRRETGELAEISFPTISAAGPHAAIPHYRVTTASNRVITPGLFLIDSGGQYRDGTTDITRTVAVGAVSDEMRDRFTRVLKGHIAIATAVFPSGTSGAQIDAFARLPLWQAGLDFDHGTGHGIGSFLSVHEGPQRISKLGTVALQPGMLLSNEPGYYKAGEYGIRLENIILVCPMTIPGAERSMLGFETLTLAPFDRRLIDVSLLTSGERDWLDTYHARVARTLSPKLDAETAAWLAEACAPLSAGA
jgi:Xaa-Pro aminopeptidase